MASPKVLLERSVARLGVEAIPLRRLCDPPMTKLAFGSLEVSFGEPEAISPLTLFDQANEAGLDLQGQLLQQSGELLSEGLTWLQVAQEGERPVDQDWRATVEALEQLVPPLRGMVTNVEIGGRLVGKPVGRPYVLDRQASGRVRAESQRVVAGHSTFSGEGHIGLFDIDRLTFTLRDQADRDTARCVFDDELFDDVMAILTAQVTCLVVGEQSLASGLVSVASIGPIERH
jgi:hypothetical protein